MADVPGLEALRLALYPIAGLPGGQTAPMAINIGGTVNIIGGGSGGTSMIDNNSFTAGGTSFTPVGGYRGGRSIASGNAAAFAIDGSGNMQVNVVAGGAGGGIANLSVRGTANSDLHVGYASGAGVNVDGGAYMPILGTVNLGAGATPFASVAVYGSPANPVYNIGSVNVVNSVTALVAGGSLSVVGSVGVTPLSSFTVNFGGVATVWYGGIGADTANSAVRVNVVAGGAGGGVANLTVVGSANTALHVGYASGAGVNVDGGAYLPVQFPAGYFPTVNSAGGGGGFATAAVYGSPAFPVYNVGSVNVVNAVGIFGSVSGLATVNLGSIPTVNLGLGTVNIGNAHGVFGSVSILGSVNLGAGGIVGIFGSTSGVASVNLGGVGVVDVRGSLSPTMWIISGAASGQFVIAGSAPASQRDWFSSFHLLATGTIDGQWMSPSGVAISGSMRLLPGAGFALAGALPNGPVLWGSQQSAIYFNSAGTGNIGGFAAGWVA